MRLNQLKPGDICRADGYLTIDGWQATVTHLPFANRDPVFPHLRAVGSPGLWRHCVPGLRYTIGGEWDGQVIRAHSCREADTHDAFTRPPQQVIDATLPHAHNDTADLEDFVVESGESPRASDSAIYHVTLTRWTEKAAIVYQDRADIAIAVMCGHPDDPFLVAPEDIRRGRTPRKELQPGDEALACGFLVPEGDRMWVIDHWNKPGRHGILLSSPAKDLGPQIQNPMQPSLLFGTWAGDHFADDGRIHIPALQDYRYANRFTVVPRYQEDMTWSTSEGQLAVLVGQANDRFVWHECEN